VDYSAEAFTSIATSGLWKDNKMGEVVKWLFFHPPAKTQPPQKKWLMYET
jgi:hypothetical protein